MSNKIFSIYRREDEAAEKPTERLTVEIAKSHIACLATNAEDNTVSSFEIFRLNKEDSDFSEVFTNIQADSKLLHQPYSESKVFIQNESSVLVPADNFKKEIAEDYLEVTATENAKTVSINDELKVGRGIVNAYRVPMNTLSMLHLNMGRIKVEHTYSQIIRNLFTPSKNIQQLIKVQFYYEHIIAAVISANTLQLIQTFSYQTPADVLYYLLNISQRLQLDPENLVLEVSGMIDLDSPMYTELINYFKNVSVEEPRNKIVQAEDNRFPAHYFTPIFNLAT